MSNCPSDEVEMGDEEEYEEVEGDEEEYEEEEEGEEDEEEGEYEEEGEEYEEGEEVEEEGEEYEEEEGGEGEEDEEEGDVELNLVDDGRLAFDGGTLEYSFRSFPSAFDFGRQVQDQNGGGGGASSAGGKGLLETLLIDCRKVFSVREQGQDGEYSEGDTFFLRADEAPVGRLEHMARAIFDFHTKDAEFDPLKSGAEWWIQVLDDGDDIGLHFDKDYSLEEHFLNIHPHVATVTYITSNGGPTMVLPCRGPLQHGSDLSTSLKGAWLSLPESGKHMSFDGQLLHSAPAELRSLWKNPPMATPTPGSGGGIREEGSHQRITLLVNIWLNHIPGTAERPVNLLPSLSQGSPVPCHLFCSSSSHNHNEGGNNGHHHHHHTAAEGGGEGAASVVTRVSVTDSEHMGQWIFSGEAKQRYTVNVPLPAAGRLIIGEGGKGGAVELINAAGVEGGVVRGGKRKREGVEEEDEEEEEEEGEEYDEQEEGEGEEEEEDEEEEEGEEGGQGYDEEEEEEEEEEDE